MPRHRREVATQVAENLFEAEAALDGALAKVAGLMGTMPLARQEARVAACVGQSAIDHVAAAITALSTARREMVAAHEALLEVQGQIGLGAVNFGGGFIKPDYPPKEQSLHIVETTSLAA